MALGLHCIVLVQARPRSSTGEAMNDIRAWLDHHKMQPASFYSSATANGVSSEIALNSEGEAAFFEREFADLVRPVRLLVTV